MKIPIKISSNLLGMSEAIQKAVSGLGKNSFHKSTQNVMYQVLEQVMIQYDATARTKDSGVLYGRIPLRTSVNRLANIKHDNDKIIFGIGDESKMPFYWKMQEFGTKSFTFMQPFRAVFNDGNLKLVAVKKSSIQGYFSYNANYSLAPGIGLIKQIQVNNPGIKARGFFAYGKAYLRSNGPTLFGQEFSELMYNIIAEHKKKKT